MVQVRLLGPVALQGRRGPVPLGGPRLRCLLAVLAMTPGQPVRMDALVDRAWGDRSPDGGRAGLHTYVSRLRRVLAEADPDAGRAALRHRDGGYALELDPAQVDLHQARSLAGVARAVDRQGEVVRASALYAQACELWSPAPLAGLENGWADRLRIGLEQERLSLLTDHFDAALRAGGHASVIGPLSQALSDHPSTESLAGLLMLALYRAGRHADALQVFTRLRRRLVEEVGGEPGPALQRLHGQILRRDPELDPATRGGAGASAPDQPWVPMCQLPPDSRHFVGRTSAVAQLVALLHPDRQPVAVPVVTLTGPPGVGKSALATRVAHLLRPAYPDGQWYVRLSGHTGGCDPAEVTGELLQACGVDRDAVPDAPERRAAALRARLAGRRVLLLLDDATDAAQVRALLPGAAGSAVLVTSRRLLSGLDGAAVVRVGPLSRDEARQLLGSLAGHARIAEAPDVADEVGRACSRLPLALRIAGSRLAAHPGWTVERLATRLRDQRRRLDELATDDLAVRPGLLLSYRSLDGPRRTAFRRIGLLGTTDLAPWTVAVLCGAADGEPLVDGLVEASLLDGVGTDPTGEPRYRLHALVATYAGELADGEQPSRRRAALRRHLDALLALAGLAVRDQRPGGEQLPPIDRDRGGPLPAPLAARLTRDPQAWLAAERTSLVAAIERACGLGWHADAALLADRTLRQLCPQIGPREAERLYGVIRDAARCAGDDLVAWRAECQRATFAAAQGHHARSATAMLACAAAFGRLGAATERAFSLGSAAGSHLFQNDLRTAFTLAGQAVAAARICDDRRVEAANLAVMAGVLSDLDRFDDARPRFERALTLAREFDHPNGTVRILSWLAAAALEHGEVDRADDACRHAVSLVDETDDPRAMGYLLNRAARIATARGRPREATLVADDARALFARIGDARGAALAALSGGQARLAAAEPGGAVPLLESAATTFAELNLAGWRAQALRSLATARGPLAESDRASVAGCRL